MLQPLWKKRALMALVQQADLELNSGYDLKESMVAISTIKGWVSRNNSLDKDVFLQQLQEFYKDVQQRWFFHGEYNGGYATLGSCYRVIKQAVLSSDDTYSHS
ncbi:hypothetical protein [Alishewanella tabrizica]|uniref:Uncharacterized protein n=1 Tax=Alishewanella tabrizica TaxID=671278 RepID=A0ABQ2WMB6_9ALTE|nr:hypothetical protein [Alishewanella tabrizica]GGW62164.1 hypothetical protein GCM10008111_17600 [Alishewanella tabrizica]